jgi:hypothetical protein
VLQAERSRIGIPMVLLEFFIDIILLAALWPHGVNSASNRNEYQEYFLEGKGSQSLVWGFEENPLFSELCHSFVLVSKSSVVRLGIG